MSPSGNVLVREIQHAGCQPLQSKPRLLSCTLPNKGLAAHPLVEHVIFHNYQTSQNTCGSLNKKETLLNLNSI